MVFELSYKVILTHLKEIIKNLKLSFYRWNFVVRRISTTGRELPTDTYELCKNWIEDWAIIFEELQRDNSKLVNMDETSIYLDFPSSYTYEKKGKRRVKATTAGGERTRLSAAFTASADGRKS